VPTASSRSSNAHSRVRLLETPLRRLAKHGGRRQTGRRSGRREQSGEISRFIPSERDFRSIDAFIFAGCGPQQLQDRFDADRLPLYVAGRQALVSTLSGGNRGISAMPLHEDVGRTPDVEVSDCHFRIGAFRAKSADAGRFAIVA
jgi:hypothetical protein